MTFLLLQTYLTSIHRVISFVHSFKFELCRLLSPQSSALIPTKRLERYLFNHPVTQALSLYTELSKVQKPPQLLPCAVFHGSVPAGPEFSDDVNIINNIVTSTLATGKAVILVMHSYGALPGYEASKKSSKTKPSTTCFRTERRRRAESSSWLSSRERSDVQ